MISRVKTLTPPNTPTPTGLQPHCQSGRTHLGRRHGRCRSSDGTTGGNRCRSLTRQFLQAFKVMLDAVGFDLDHTVHIDIFLKRMADF